MVMVISTGLVSGGVWSLESGGAASMVFFTYENWGGYSISQYVHIILHKNLRSIKNDVMMTS